MRMTVRVELFMQRFHRVPYEFTETCGNSVLERWNLQEDELNLTSGLQGAKVEYSSLSAQSRLRPKK